MIRLVMDRKSFVFISITFLMISLNIGVQAEVLAALPATVNAKADAKRDALADVNRRRWLATGCLLHCGCGIGLSATALVMTQGDRYTAGAEMITLCIGTYLVPWIGFTRIHSHQPDPPSSRLIGKSAEYVNVYASTYKSKRSEIQVKWAAAGYLGGCLLGGGVLLLRYIRSGGAVYD